MKAFDILILIVAAVCITVGIATLANDAHKAKSEREVVQVQRDAATAAQHERTCRDFPELKVCQH